MVHEHAGGIWIVTWNMGQGKGELNMDRSYSITALYIGCVAYVITITFAVLLVLGAIYFLF